MKRSNWFRCTTPIRTASTWCTPASTWRCSRPETSGPPALRSGLDVDDPMLAFVGPHPAAESTRCAAARGGQTARSACGGRRWAVGQWVGRAGRADSAGRRIGYRRPGDVSCRRNPAINSSTCTGQPTWSRCRAIRNPSAWWPSRRRPAAPRWWPPPSAGYRSRVRDGVTGTLVDGHGRRRLVAGDRRALAAWSREHEPRRRRARGDRSRGRHTVDALLGSYGRAIADYRARHRLSDVAARRNGRRFAMRRGIRA